MHCQQWLNLVFKHVILTEESEEERVCSMKVDPLDFITNDILKFSCWVWKFMYCNLLLPYFIYLIIDGKKYLSIKKVVKDLRNLLMIKTLGIYSNNCRFVSCWIPYVQVNSLNYSPFSSLPLLKKYKDKGKEN